MTSRSGGVAIAGRSYPFAHRGTRSPCRSRPRGRRRNGGGTEPGASVGRSTSLDLDLAQLPCHEADVSDGALHRERGGHRHRFCDDSDRRRRVPRAFRSRIRPACQMHTLRRLLPGDVRWRRRPARFADDHRHVRRRLHSRGQLHYAAGHPHRADRARPDAALPRAQREKGETRPCKDVPERAGLQRWQDRQSFQPALPDGPGDLCEAGPGKQLRWHAKVELLVSKGKRHARP